MKIKIIDVETASLKGTILEVGAVGINNNFKLESLEDDLIRPPDGTVIDYEAMAVHGLTPRKLEGKPSFEEVKHKYNDADIYIAHNYKFDKRMLSQEDPSFEDKQWLCTLKLARMLYHDAPSYKLMALFYYLGLDEGFDYEGKAHAALYDARVTYELLLHMMKTTGVDTVEELLYYKSDIAKETCKFGKHRGMTWETILDMDKPYCRWLLGNALKKQSEEDIREWLEDKLK